MYIHNKMQCKIKTNKIQFAKYNHLSSVLERALLIRFAVPTIYTSCFFFCRPTCTQFAFRRARPKVAISSSYGGRERRSAHLRRPWGDIWAVVFSAVTLFFFTRSEELVIIGLIDRDIWEEQKLLIFSWSASLERIASGPSNRIQLFHLFISIRQLSIGAPFTILSEWCDYLRSVTIISYSVLAL